MLWQLLGCGVTAAILCKLGALCAAPAEPVPFTDLYKQRPSA